MTKPPASDSDTVPPPEVKGLVEKIAGQIAKDGPDSEAKIRKKEQGNPKFSFMNAGDPNYEYFQQKIKDASETKGGKKSKKKKKRDDSDDEDIEKTLAELALEYSGGNTEKPVETEDISNDLTDMKKKKKKGDKAPVEEEPDESNNKTDKKSKKKKKKRGDSDDEDLEKELAELALEYSGVKKEVSEEPKPVEELEEETNKKKEKKKKEKVVEPDDDEDTTGTVKTAAQKKKEKKEREKAKKLAEKQGTAGATVKKQDSVEKEVGKKQVEGEEPEPDTKDKKKKKTKEDEKDKKKTGKGPDKKQIAAMQEALKKIKEEEERLIREEEERIRREEEAEKERLEQLRLEQEKKEKKKQKEKERKDRLKAEGKLLTPKQKADRARAQAMLQAIEEQRKQLQEQVGITEEVAEPKKPRLGTRIRPNKLKKDSSQEKPVEEPKVEPEETKVVEVTPVEEVKKEEDDVKDSWDMESSEEEEEEMSSETTETKTEKKEVGIQSKKQEVEDSSSDESDDEDGSSSEESSSDDSEENLKQSDAARKRAKAMARIQKRREEAEKNQSVDDLRAAVVCVLGHVDTGKTKILDKLRRTNVQDGEAGGITQQIGATNVPIENIKEQTKIVKGFADMEMKLPGLLIIDTPGHESFSNLRNRGSSLCDIAILVVDIMHGLEPQTIESISLLKTKRVPFIVALNKIDRLYDWQTMNRKDVRDILKAQASHTQLEFETRTKDVLVQFSEQGLNAALFYENPDPKTYVSLVPTSAITGEGMGNLLALIVDMCQSHLAKRLMYSAELQATVLEVKAIPGLGTTIDVILVNGVLKEGDTMLLAGTDGPVVTQIRSLLMPQPMRELRVKNAYIEHREVKAAQGVKIAAKELEKAIAGLNLVVAHHPDEVEVLKEEVARELKSALSSIKLQERGVFVQASTLGSLEALLDFLRSSKIPYAGIRIGPVVKKDVMKASIMLEHDSQYATILAFDVKIERDAQELADNLGVKIFQADIIYHLFDKFTAYRDELKQRKRDEFKHIAVFPCKLRVLPQFVFNSRDPIVCGVMVEAGIVKEGTPICVPSKEFVELGIVTSIESNHKTVESARKGQEICIKIDPIPGESPKMFGRHFDETDMLISKISRQSIDACKDYFRDDLVKTDWQLMVELKKMFQIL